MGVVFDDVVWGLAMIWAWPVCGQCPGSGFQKVEAYVHNTF